MLCSKDIYKLNMFDFLRPYEAKVRKVYERHGTSAAKNYVYKFFRMKLTRKEIKEFLEIDNSYLVNVNEVHRLAWSTCGWNGSYNPIAAHRYMDTCSYKNKKDKQIELTKNNELQVMANQNTVNLIAAGLLSPGKKFNFYRFRR